MHCRSTSVLLLYSSKAFISSFLAGQLSTTFADVCVDPKSTETLKSVAYYPLMYPGYFKTGVFAKAALGGIMLYGPPGTGKTLLCRALACECNARMLLVKPSDILSKWLGESEQFSKAVFVSSTHPTYSGLYSFIITDISL